MAGFTFVFKNNSRLLVFYLNSVGPDQMQHSMLFVIVPSVEIFEPHVIG